MKKIFPEGTIRTRSNGIQVIKKDGKWVHVKKPKGYFKKDQPKEKWVPNFPPVNLPDHIKETKYPHYYVSKYGVAYREPRRCDENGRFGEINEWGLIEMKTQLRGNPYNESKMYESVNIYFYDENDKNVGHQKKNIHQLVAETWIPNPHGYKEVLHGEKGNRCNHYTNLRWGTHKENMKESSHALPEGSIRHYNGDSSRYIKKNGEWVLIPSDRPIWNKGLKGVSWNTLPDGTVRMRRVNDGYGKFIKQDGKWVYQKKEGKRKSLPDGSISKDGQRKKINGEWVYQKTKRVVSQKKKKCEPLASSTKVNGLYPDGTITTRSDGTKWKKENGKWVYQKIKIK